MSYTSEVAADSPVAWWHLNETSGTTATDAVGTNHGTYEGTPTLGVASLALNDAGTAVTLTNQASRQAIQVPGTAAALNPDSITVEMLVSVVGWDNNNRLLQKGATDNHYRLYRDSSDNTVRWDVAGHGVVSMPAFYGRHHVAATYDAASGRVRLYLDGVMLGNLSGTGGAMTDTTDTLLIGHKSTTSPVSDGFDGTIDEVAIYSSELSAARILAHAQAAPITPTQLAWKGYTWNLASRAPADPFVNAFAPDQISVDGSGYVHMKIAAAAGQSVGAELSNVTQGLGYGTYTCVIGSRVDNLHPNVVVGGMFTFGADAAYGHREIDACEQSMWSGATGPCTLGHVHWQSSVPGNPYGARGGYDAADITTLSDTSQTNVMIWQPGQIIYRTYHGTTTTPANLFREDIVSNGDNITFGIEGGGTFNGAAVIPVPGDERVHFNLWVCPNFSGTSDPATVTATDIIIRDFSFVPASSSTGESRFFDGVTFPSIQVLAGFGGTLDPGAGYIHLGVGPGLGTGLLGGPGVGVNEVDITGDVRSISITPRGPASDIDQADPVTCSIVLNNFDGTYHPANPTSPWAGQLVDGTPLRVRWTWNSIAYDRFYGELSHIEHNVDNDWDVTATMVALDGQEKLSRAYLPLLGVPTGDGHRTGARIGYLADQAAYPSALRSIETGYTTLPGTVLGETAMELMAKTASTEFGTLFIDGSGRITFYDRHHGATAARSTSTQATFGDTAGAIPLRDISEARDRDRAFNRVALTRDPIPEVPNAIPDVEFDDAPDEPVEQVADDFTIQTTKGVLAFPAQVGQLLRNDFEVLALAQYLVGRFKTVTDRISELNVSTLSTPSSLFATLLGLGPLDRVAVDQGYGPADITATLLIQSVTEEIVADPPAWTLTFTTSPPPPAPNLFVIGTGQLGSSSNGKLGW